MVPSVRTENTGCVNFINTGVNYRRVTWEEMTLALAILEIWLEFIKVMPLGKNWKRKNHKKKNEEEGKGIGGNWEWLKRDLLPNTNSDPFVPTPALNYFWCLSDSV